MKTLGKLRLVTVLVGVLTALMIVCSQVFYFEFSKPVAGKVETEQQGTSSSNQEEVISLPTTYSLPASTNVLQSHEFSFIEEILLNGKLTDFTPVDVQISIGGLFKTLFHFIIAPNAP